MLESLIIKNIALIEHSEINFGVGLNILTGETGAGKSIIIDSLNFVLGARGDKSLIRYGQNSAEVEANYVLLKTDSAYEILQNYELGEELDLTVFRSMSVEGKNVCRVNGIKVSLTVLKELGGCLVDIYGQHENSALLNESTHLAILDGFGTEKLSIYKSEVAELFGKFNVLNKELKKYGSIKDVEKKLEFIKDQIEEIEDAQISVGEFESLVEKEKVFDNVEEIVKNLTSAVEIINGEQDETASGMLGSCQEYIDNVTDFSKEILSCSERLDSLRIELNDIASDLNGVLSSVDFDEQEAVFTADRLALIRKMFKKYGRTEADILEHLEKIKQEYDELSGCGDKLEELKFDKELCVNKLKNSCNELTKQRQKVAEDFVKKIETEMKELGMPNTKMSVNFNKLTTELGFASNGQEDINFLLSPNAGQPMKPLAKIISGGEMSRLMLAIKNIIAGIDGVSCMVFDEVDTGISGDIAQIVACKLFNISCNRQVLAVTHLPQLSSMADRHYLIKKTTDNITTQTTVNLLSREDSIKEVARLVGGRDIGEHAIPHATKMKEWADSYKTKTKN